MLASGTGNTTYVFTVILALFLTGLAIGALLFNSSGRGSRDPARLLAAAQVLVGALVLFGLVAFIARPTLVDPGESARSARRRWSAPPSLVVLLTTIVLGLTFPAASAMLSSDPATAGRSTGTFLAVNTLGSISGSFLVPFLLIPALGSPHAAALLALINVASGAAIAIDLASRAGSRALDDAGRGRRRRRRDRRRLRSRRAVLVSPNEARLKQFGARHLCDDRRRDRDGRGRPAPVDAGAVGRRHLDDPAHGRREPDADPAADRPAGVERALIVAFGMGTAFRSALTAGLQDGRRSSSCRPCRRCSTSITRMPTAVLANPNGKVIIADGRNHLELTDERFDIIVTDPPPPIESSGASVISSREYYQAGHDHLTPGGVMMQWIPYGQTINEFKAHVRAFHSVFPEVTIVFGPGGYGTYMLGSDEPITFEPRRDPRRSSARPGILEDISSGATTARRTRSRAGWPRSPS